MDDERESASSQGVTFVVRVEPPLHRLYTANTEKIPNTGLNVKGIETNTLDKLQDSHGSRLIGSSKIVVSFLFSFACRCCPAPLLSRPLPLLLFCNNWKLIIEYVITTVRHRYKILFPVATRKKKKTPKDESVNRVEKFYLSLNKE